MTVGFSCSLQSYFDMQNGIQSIFKNIQLLDHEKKLLLLPSCYSNK